MTREALRAFLLLELSQVQGDLLKVQGVAEELGDRAVLAALQVLRDKMPKPTGYTVFARSGPIIKNETRFDTRKAADATARAYAEEYGPMDGSWHVELRAHADVTGIDSKPFPIRWVLQYWGKR